MELPDMRVALLGGTGDIGEGIALRLTRDTDYDVIIGSRDPEKARQKAVEYERRLSNRGHSAVIEGFDNLEAAERAEIAVVSVPPEYVVGTIETVAENLNSNNVLVCPATQMNRNETGFHYKAPSAGSITEAASSAAPEAIPVIGAFQNVAAGALTDLDNELNADVVLTGNDGDAKETVTQLVEAINGLRALNAGSLANSAEVESITPLLINLAMNNEGMHDLGVRFQ